MIQPLPTAKATAARHTPNVRKNAIALRRLLIRTERL
jgi:hypothetical protein